MQPIELDCMPRITWGPPGVYHLRRRQEPASVVVVNYVRRMGPYGIPEIGLRPSQKACLSEISWIYKMHTQQGEKDIRQNFLVCADGNAYAGRGWSRVPSLPDHYREYNDKALFIGYVGDFSGEVDRAHDYMVKQRDRLLMIGIRKNYLEPKFLYIEMGNSWKKAKRIKHPTNFRSSIYM